MDSINHTALLLLYKCVLDITVPSYEYTFWQWSSKGGGATEGSSVCDSHWWVLGYTKQIYYDYRNGNHGKGHPGGYWTRMEGYVPPDPHNYVIG